MSYATVDDLLPAIATSDLIALTDDDVPNEINNEVVAEVLSDAAAQIDSWCSNRYRVPLRPVPRLAKILSVDLAVFALYSRRPHLDLPDAVKERYRQAVEFLKKVNEGRASMGNLAPPIGSSDGGKSGLVPGNARIFGRKQTRWF